MELSALYVRLKISRTPYMYEAATPLMPPPWIRYAVFIPLSADSVFSFIDAPADATVLLMPPQTFPVTLLTLAHPEDTVFFTFPIPSAAEDFIDFQLVEKSFFMLLQSR